MFLDCPRFMGLTCPNATTRAKVLRGIQTGSITYHAHPHKAQLEFYDPSLLEFSFDLTHDMDRRFGFKPKTTMLLVRSWRLALCVKTHLQLKPCSAVSLLQHIMHGFCLYVNHEPGMGDTAGGKPPSRAYAYL